ncbi:MAG: 2-succinyl-5-enolpyruvyl-6-hydroxy-3-cyclohexene-1-carboxylic-acid synthase [Bacteriovoracaceae bacterium]|nr:2-succinyl-5-enolpyruvyl-6-hydroxy-3-cyclohexene-1-carboxylic-acid synthase [Bacteriovoracaceae bacterium]
MDRDRQQNAKLPTDPLGFLTNNLNWMWASLIIDQLVKHDLNHFVISPGLRNAPLIAAVEAHPLATHTVIIDERSASYYALGYAKAQASSAVLVCTSGTAMANYMPAVIEAYKSDTPLFILTADRPTELISSGDNQTMDQINLFDKYTQAFLNLTTPTEEISPNALSRSIANLIFKSKYPVLKPVHMNCPFREPLGSDKAFVSSLYLNWAKEIYATKQPATNNLIAKQSDIDVHLPATDRVCVVIGTLENNLNKKHIKKLIGALKVPFYLDVTSSLRFGFTNNNNFIPSLDNQFIKETIFNKPFDTIIHIGGKVVSKSYYQYLKQMPPKQMIVANKSLERQDPSDLTTLKVNICPNQYAKLLRDTHLTKMEAFSTSCQEFIPKAKQLVIDLPINYWNVANVILEQIKSGAALYLGNSMAIRCFDSYVAPAKPKELQVVSNRGVSGIEGFVASACGYAKGCNDAVTLVIGDISMLHDLSSLSILSETVSPVTIVVINNGGGKIFKHLPIGNEPQLTPIITSPHNFNFEFIARQFGINYQIADSVKCFKQVYSDSQRVQEHTLIELQTLDEDNLNAHRKLNNLYKEQT